MRTVLPLLRGYAYAVKQGSKTRVDVILIRKHDSTVAFISATRPHFQVSQRHVNKRSILISTFKETNAHKALKEVA